MEAKSFPWPGASNVKFPLLTIACLQYHSRAYPSLIDTPDIVKCVPEGDDPKSEKYQAASIVSDHMNWQMTEECTDWESEMDKTLLVQALMGSCFKKVYFDPIRRHNVSECVLPQDLVVSYYTRSLDTAPRVTHVLSWSHNRMMEEQARGSILETKELESPKSLPIPFGALDTARDESQGVNSVGVDPDQPFVVLEQHLWLDLDGDNYLEPYIALVRYDNRSLLALRPRFLPSGIEHVNPRDPESGLLRIVPETFFTKYGFIPSPDGGFYDMGFGHLLGPLNESINTSINQLFDAGTLKNAGGGFIGKGARTKSGEIAMRPAMWVRVDSVGDDLRKNIMPLPVPEPSSVLFQLLNLLIDYGQRVAGAPDSVQGQNPGQNTPAETSRNMTEQGLKLFAGIYKRTHRAMRDEFRLWFRLNQLYLEESQSFASPATGASNKVLQKMYHMPTTAIRPSADPVYMSDAQRQAQANALLQAARAMPGYNLYEVNKFYLKTLRIPGIDTFYPNPKGPNAVPPIPNPKVQIEQMKLQAKQMQMKMDMQIKLFELTEEHRVNDAKIRMDEAQMMKLVADAQNESHGLAIEQYKASIQAMQAQQNGRAETIRILHDITNSMHNQEMDHAQHDQQQEQQDHEQQMDPQQPQETQQ
jgi:chaperonin GroES